jgi:hypothetical protein
VTRSYLTILPQTLMQFDWMTPLLQIDEKLSQDQIDQVFQTIKQFHIVFTHSNCSLMHRIKNIVRPLFCSSQLYHHKKNSHISDFHKHFLITCNFVIIGFLLDHCKSSYFCEVNHSERIALPSNLDLLPLPNIVQPLSYCKNHHVRRGDISQNGIEFKQFLDRMII